jgi:hypothetical protein
MSSSRFRNEPSRAVVQRCICPRCGAERGAPCIGTRGLRKSNHIQRVNAWKRLHDPKPPRASKVRVRYECPVCSGPHPASECPNEASVAEREAQELCVDLQGFDRALGE